MIRVTTKQVVLIREDYCDRIRFAIEPLQVMSGAGTQPGHAMDSQDFRQLYLVYPRGRQAAGEAHLHVHHKVIKSIRGWV